jgi:hypothetical protein
LAAARRAATSGLGSGIAWEYATSSQASDAMRDTKTRTQQTRMNGRSYSKQQRNVKPKSLQGSHTDPQPPLRTEELRKLNDKCRAGYGGVTAVNRKTRWDWVVGLHHVQPFKVCPIDNATLLQGIR